MTNYTKHTIETAPADSKPFLQGAKDLYGFVPNLLANMAEAPVILEGYMTLAATFNKSSFSETERQIILMTNNLLNGCTYCMSAHTAIAQMGGVEADVIKSLRTNTPIADEKLEALRQFAIAMNKSRGWPETADLDAFYAAGYNNQNALELVTAMAVKLMSNYTNHLAGTELDEGFKAVEWTQDELK